MQIVSSDLSKKQIETTLHLQSTQSNMMADPIRLQQVFWNILTNAIKFTPEKGKILIVTKNNEAPASGHVRSITNNNLQTTNNVEQEQEHPQRCLIRIEISDTGIGIEPQVLANLFKPFEQGDPAITMKYGGLGLGLALSKALVERHGGQLMAKSKGEGLGAKFIVELPVSSKKEEESVTKDCDDDDVQRTEQRNARNAQTTTTSLVRERGQEAREEREEEEDEKQINSEKEQKNLIASFTSAPSSSSSSSSSVLQEDQPQQITSDDDYARLHHDDDHHSGASGCKVKILLVEDNKCSQMILCRLLRKRLGCDVWTAASVGEALQVAENERGRFDLVISDLGLPDASGLDLMPLLKQRYPALRGMALTGFGMEEDMRRSKQAGFEIHLTKPVNFGTLEKAIKQLLKSPQGPTKPA